MAYATLEVSIYTTSGGIGGICADSGVVYIFTDEMLYARK